MIGQSIFFKIKNGILTSYYGKKANIMIPKNVSSIGYSAFRDCGFLKSVIIPNSVTKIEGCAFYGCTGLESVTIPSSVKKIESGAFQYCKNLKEITLNEGLEAIDSHTFIGCENLKKVIYPDSVKKYQGWTFYNTQLSEPVLNRSKTLLVYCPQKVSDKEWSVPETVQRISWQAFIEHDKLEKLHLPEGLKIIERMAIINCGIKEITIPYSVQRIEKEAFYSCDSLEYVTILNPDTFVAKGAFSRCNNIKNIRYGNITDSDKIFHLLGQPFLIPHCEDSANLQHDLEPSFRIMLSKCSKGNPDDMNDIAKWFEKYSFRDGASPFYLRAANYWRYCAYCKGNTEATQWFSDFFKEHNKEHLESILCEKGFYISSIYGKILNDLGFDFFDAKKYYSIMQYDEGLVEVSSFLYSEEPDEDGFGAENNYEWWFLNENMQPIPGVCSTIATPRERNSKYFLKKFEEAKKLLNQTKLYSSDT